MPYGQAADISSYRDELSKRFKPPTINRKLASVWRRVRWRGDSSDLIGMAKPVPIEKCPESPSEGRFLSQKEEKRLLQSMQKNEDPFHLAALLLMLRMGLRPSELCSLWWGNVDLVQATSCRGEKTGNLRYLPLEPACSAALSKIGSTQVSQRDALVFSQVERPHTRRILERMLEKYSREADLPSLTLHVLRCTFATRFAKGGASLFLLAAFLGHKRLDVLQKYYLRPDPTRSGHWVRMHIKP